MALVCGARQSHLFAVAPGLAPCARVVGRNAGQAADSINDWYPEKVNQAFSRKELKAGLPLGNSFLPASEIGVAFPAAKS